MENKKEMLSKAYKEGKTIQSKSSGEWKDFEPQNQVDSPNFDYKGIDNWRIKPETLEEAAERHAKMAIYPSAQDDVEFGFRLGVKWQAERMYTEEEVLELLWNYENRKTSYLDQLSVKKWFEQFKKK